MFKNTIKLFFSFKYIFLERKLINVTDKQHLFINFLENFVVEVCLRKIFVTSSANLGRIKTSTCMSIVERLIPLESERTENTQGSDFKPFIGKKQQKKIDEGLMFRNFHPSCSSYF